MPGVYHIPFCNPFRDPTGETESVSKVISYIENDLFKTTVDPKEVAAIFVEPILGEGGYVIPTKFFIKELRRICDEHGILLVFDEVQSGVGRTGYMYASEYFGVAPDIFTTAKGIASGMPLGAIVAKEKVMNWPKGSHGSTYGGNPVACAASLATLEVIEGLLPQIQRVGKYALSELKKLQERQPVIGDIRGTGLMIGVEFVDPKTNAPAGALMEKLEQLSFKKGLLLLGCGASTIRLAPPLVVTEHEIDVMVKIMEECIIELTK